MRIVIGRGNARHVFDVPAGPSRVLNQDGKPSILKNKAWRIPREQMAEQIKNFLFRPGMIAA